MNRVVMVCAVLSACHSDPAAPDAVPTCQASTECTTDSWCNPGTNTCVSRTSTVDFDATIHSRLTAQCVACHSQGGIGAGDRTGTGVTAEFDQGAEATYQVLIAGGTNCGTGQHRLCADEPQNSLIVQRLLPDNGVQMFSYADGYHNPWMQQLMQWIAAGAPRTATP